MLAQQFIAVFLDMVPATCILLLLHYLRHSIGHHSLHILLAVFLLLGLLSGLPGFAAQFEIPNFSDALTYGSLTVPIFTALLFIYEVHGTAEAQRIILGLALTLLFMGLFISLSLSYYCNPVFATPSANLSLGLFVNNLRQGLLIFTVTHLILLLSIPIIFQGLRNIRCPFSLSLLFCNGLVMLGRELDISFLFPSMHHRELAVVWGVRLLVAAIVSLIVTLYLRFCTTAVFERKRTFGIITGIFHHLKTTDALRKSMAEWAEKYQTVLNHSQDLIFIVDSLGQVVNANIAAYHVLTGFAPEKMNIRSFITDAKGAPFSIPTHWFQEILSDTSDARSANYCNMFLCTADAKRKMAIDFSISHASVDGEPLALIIARDMTEQRRQEAERAKLQEQLYHSQRMESMGILAGGVAHDFNNLLHSIQGSADALRQAPMPPSSLSMVSNIDEATRRAAELISQLLGFARKGNYNVQAISLSELLGQVSNLFKTTTGSIIFKTLIEPGNLIIRADSTQLQQVILNLLINARDAFSSDSIPSDRPPKIVLRGEKARTDTPEWQKRTRKDASLPDDYVCIKVKDNGCGIPADVLPHIFEPFFTTKEQGKGTGMGLAMAYGCIEALHGWLHVESTPGIGTEFTIVLPLDHSA